MDASWITGSLVWVATNPWPSLLGLAFIVALESLFIIGVFIPGSALMFAAGAMIAAGHLPLLPTLLASALGAWAGDCLSFLIGAHSRHDLTRLCTRFRLQRALERGERFFADHGTLSVIFGRMIGPLRPLVPAIAGAADMKLTSFLAVDLLAALIWAPAYALPGLVIGTTLSVAAEVATRLALVIALFVGAVWLLVWTLRAFSWLFQEKAERWIARLMDWTHRHRRLGVLGPSLADPEQPETPVLMGCAIALMLIGWLLGVLIWGLDAARPPGIDELSYDWLAGFTLPALPIIVSTLSAIGSRETCAALVLTGFATFSALRMTRANAHWAATCIVGLLLGLVLPGRDTTLSGLAPHSEAPEALLLATLVSGCAGLLATRHGPVVRSWLYSAAGSIIGLVLFAKLLIGSVSATQAALALGLALTWNSLLLLGYRRHLRGSRRAPLALSASLAATALLLPALLLWNRDLPRVPNRDRDPGIEYSEAAWSARRLAEQPARVNLVWVGERSDIESLLRSLGWTDPPALSLPTASLWLRSGAVAQSRPPLPRALSGRMPELELLSRQDGAPPRLLRLWRSQESVHQQGPIWYGVVGELIERRWFGLMTIPVSRLDEDAVLSLSDQFTQAVVRQERLVRRTAGYPATLIIGPGLR